MRLFNIRYSEVMHKWKVYKHGQEIAAFPEKDMSAFVYAGMEALDPTPDSELAARRAPPSPTLGELATLTQNLIDASVRDYKAKVALAEELNGECSAEILRPLEATAELTHTNRIHATEMYVAAVAALVASRTAA